MKSRTTDAGNEKTRYRRCTREIQRSWNIAAFECRRSFVHKVRRDLEASDSNVESVAKRRKHKRRSDTVRTPQFVQQVQDIIDEDPSK